MHPSKTGFHFGIGSLGLMMAVGIAISGLSSSCLLDTQTNLCEASGRRCDPGQVCAAKQDACIDIGGCGDGIVTGTEECDDGNIVDRDGCSADCKSTEKCGNGKLDLAVGETCDDENTIDGDGCSSRCIKERCGDGKLDFGEECDSGGAITLACNGPICKISSCGDSYYNPIAGEKCDTGGDSQTCDSDCTIPACGDGHLNLLHSEECDDGMQNNDEDPNRCRTNCRKPWCGDNVKDNGEECDNGINNSDTAPNRCRTNCHKPSCGDNVRDSGEECDGTTSCSAGICIACQCM